MRIDHIIEKNEENVRADDVFIPSDTYAYATQGAYVMKFNREVQIRSFWLRLHRSPKADFERSEGTRTVQVFSASGLVAESTFLLTSDEWVLIKPKGTDGSISGNMLIMQPNTDIDSIKVGWKDSISDENRIQMSSEKFI